MAISKKTNLKVETEVKKLQKQIDLLKKENAKTKAALKISEQKFKKTE